MTAYGGCKHGEAKRGGGKGTIEGEGDLLSLHAKGITATETKGQHGKEKNV